MGPTTERLRSLLSEHAGRYEVASLTAQDWQRAMRVHESEADAALAAHLHRRAAGVTHPVEDFLFSYYSYRPAQLRRWHPGIGVRLEGEPPHAGWRGYRRSQEGVSADPGAVVHRLVRDIRRLLVLSARRPAATACFGLHEWAMVYRAQEVRHPAWPLRLGSAATDAVVDSQRLTCTHFDAFRFFTDAAVGLNAHRPSRATQADLDQPGCLHVTMDLYKWAYKLAPLTPSSLVLRCFRLARRARELDMRASPYDLADLGYPPVRIESAAGRAEYAAAQRALAAEAVELRTALVAVCGRALPTDSEVPRLTAAARPA